MTRPQTRYPGPIPSTLDPRPPTSRGPYARLVDIERRALAEQAALAAEAAEGDATFMTVYEYAEACGIGVKTAYGRLRKYGVADGSKGGNTRTLRTYPITPNMIHRRQIVDPEVGLCEAELLADEGERLEVAAKRIGYRTTDAMERALQRAGRNDLVARLKSNRRKK